MRSNARDGLSSSLHGLGYAKLHDLPTAQGYLRRVGIAAGPVLRETGSAPGKTQHPAYGTVNTYPAWVLERAFADVAVAAGRTA
ncbi:hypothetical protein [Saccharopolyspora sp. ASAGF58]|uniref:hypothetical protein n=1 Tax=Saccharopolyspora sp. ASAGF58 TaxID=2719023 RepID=UPI0014400533|nr:hypothetical protein [Saccharopolyspora sp. ASAGF58]QIZ36590.1 hypothetical protein FDZ84_20395 [Saccharopolyspora sp. ASAGF58]